MKVELMREAKIWTVPIESTEKSLICVNASFVLLFFYTCTVVYKV